MQFSLVASLALIAGLAGNALATAIPAADVEVVSPDVSPVKPTVEVVDETISLEERAKKRPPYRIDMFTDRYCSRSKQTGSLGDNHTGCHNLMNNVYSIEGSMKDGNLMGRCSWYIQAYKGWNCKDPLPGNWGLLNEHKCINGPKSPKILSVKVWEFGPC